jgi:2-oxoglutarate ferredoxin oxidoreductase subunit alpha
VGLLRLKTIWPFDERLMAELDQRKKKIFVPEMNRGQMLNEIQKYVHGEIIPYQQTNGKIIHPKQIMEQIERIL